MRVRAKICGIMRVEDALAAVQAGADAVGFVFAESPRRVTPEEASRIVSILPPFVCPVGVFVDAASGEVQRTAREVGLHCVQLAGGESPEYIGKLAGLTVIKTIHVAGSEDVERAARYEDAWILLDTASAKAAGGTGEVFPWRYAAGLAAARQVILAGGLGPCNVAQAIDEVRPWGVDVSSGVETSPGIKDAGKIRDFIAAVRSAGDAQSQD
ncbi:MAG: phosphoribosylanthranilate isomerase [Planctomycetes bacterium]|nr:phosphoribosylanthranilate isomerase [Planctomycetota bacterium]